MAWQGVAGQGKATDPVGHKFYGVFYCSDGVGESRTIFGIIKTYPLLMGQPNKARDKEPRMKTALVTIVGESPYSQSRQYTHEVPHLNKETHDAYEDRTWRNRLHVNKAGKVEIPGTAFANAVKEAAKRLKLQVPGKGRTEYTKYIEAGVMVPSNLVLDATRETAECDRLFVPSDGRPGGGKRVWKNFPRIDTWGGRIMFYIFDDIITSEVFTKVLTTSGQIVGIGRFRPQNRGFYGRFTVDSIEWADTEV